MEPATVIFHFYNSETGESARSRPILPSMLKNSSALYAATRFPGASSVVPFSMPIGFSPASGVALIDEIWSRVSVPRDLMDYFGEYTNEYYKRLVCNRMRMRTFNKSVFIRYPSDTIEFDITQWTEFPGHFYMLKNNNTGVCQLAFDTYTRCADYNPTTKISATFNALRKNLRFGCVFDNHTFAVGCTCLYCEQEFSVSRFILRQLHITNTDIYIINRLHDNDKNVMVYNYPKSAERVVYFPNNIAYTTINLQCENKSTLVLQYVMNNDPEYKHVYEKNLSIYYKPKL